MLTLSVISWPTWFLSNKKLKESMKKVSIDRENLQKFWMNWQNSMKFSAKMWIMIISKMTKNHVFTLSLEDTFLEKPQGGRDRLKQFADCCRWFV